MKRKVAVLAAVIAALAVVVGVSVPVGAHDHEVPKTLLKQGTKVLQEGTKVEESHWVYPSGGVCANETAFYEWRFPEVDRVAADARLKVRIFKRQKPDSFEIAAYSKLDKDGIPVGDGQPLERNLRRVVRDGKTVGWMAVFEVEGGNRHYYLVGEGHWEDRQGCGADQYASWSFHVRTGDAS